MTQVQFRHSEAIGAFLSFDPLKGIYCAVTRMTPEGTPKGGWYPQGCISVEAALRHYTRDGAYATFDDEIRGVLRKGMLADLVVLSKIFSPFPHPKFHKRKSC